MTVELVDAGVLSTDALDRVKRRIVQDLALSRPPHLAREEFEAQLKQRLDRLFAGEEKLGPVTPEEPEAS